jgi:superfamily II DNA or RNA helicase
MGRRFPPPIVGIERGPDWVPTLVAVAEETDGSLTTDEFSERCRTQLPKSDGSYYSQNYFKRILSTYIQLGVVREVDGHITLWQYARELDPRNEDEYAELLWRGIKQSWVLAANFPEGIEALRRVQQVVKDAAGPIRSQEIRERLTDQYGYEYNDGGIRGYPELLTQLNALTETDDGYVLGPKANNFQDRWRNADIFYQLERWLHHRGPSVEPPRPRIKRALAKYYMYRESGGWGRHRQLYREFLEDFVSSTSQSSDVAHPQIHLSEKYHVDERTRKDLRDEVKAKFEGITGRDLSGLYGDSLEEILAADTESEAREILATVSAGISRRDLQAWADDARPAYAFPQGFELYDWQQEAVADWFSDGVTPSETGIAQVVTGAGKTVMALAAVNQWLEKHPDGRVTVVVPTKVLMHQWLEEFVTKLNVPPGDIGWAGGGHKESHADRRVLVSIVNTAVKDDFLKESLDAAGNPEHLLVADECHRYTGDVHSNVLRYPHDGSLGLSATPLSTLNPTEEELTGDDELLQRTLGRVFYRLSYDEGVSRGLVSEFTVKYIGFDLTHAERHTYEQFSKKVSTAVQDIEARYGHRLPELNGTFPQKLHTLRESAEGPTPAIADFFEYTQRRRELIAEALPRRAISLSLLQETVANDQQAIVFQDRIQQLERMVSGYDARDEKTQTGKYGSKDQAMSQLYDQYETEVESLEKELDEFFFSGRYAPVMYHSGHQNEEWNDWSIDWFREDGFANVMLSVQALKEGVDVPAADVGIIKSSSGNVRDRIQTLGRILRTGHDPDLPSTLYVLYARDTVDENMFRGIDWEETIGGDHEYWKWETGDQNAIRGELVGPSTEYEPDVSEYQPVEIPDVSDLQRGDPYEGPRRGRTISVDSDGRPFKDTEDGRRFITNDPIQEIADYVYDLRKGGGRIIINEADHMLTVTDDGAVFLGVLDLDSFDYEKPPSTEEDVPETFDDFIN